MSEEWPVRRLAEVTTKIGSGATPRGGSDAYHDRGVPLLRSQNVHFDGVRADGLVYLDDEQARALESVTVATGDVLLNITGASIGRVATAPEAYRGARVNQHVAILRPSRDLDGRFLAAYLASPEQQSLINQEEAGATRQALTKGKLEEWEVPVPPLDEQLRIVAKLDALRARSRRAKDALDAIPALLDRLRQSILAAAFRGDLTADWREQNPNVEPASELLKRIRIERRKRWEEAELAKVIAKGKPPKDDRWKDKYVEPAPVDEDGLPELPDTWCWAQLGSVCDADWGNTSLTKAAYAEEGAQAFSASGPDGFIPHADHDEDGIVVSAIGARCGRAFRATGRWTAIKNTMTLTRIAAGVDVDVLLAFADDEHVWPKRGGAQPFIALADARRLALPLAPTAEQTVIAVRLGALARQQASTLRSASGCKSALERLDASVLSAAFAGALRGDSV